MAASLHRRDGAPEGVGGQEDLALESPRARREAQKDVQEDLVSSGTGRIRPRARLIRTIGAELISSELVAVTELVRNCYDADATRVEIRFEDPHLPESSSLEIRDNGHGMSRGILLGPWLEPATAHKRGRDNSETMGGSRSPRGRRRLGSKGVGRFAAQRLGDHLQVRTSTADARTELVATFDWKSLDRADRYLDQLKIPWREVKATTDWHGTSLLIERLCDAWTEERFDRLRLGLSRLVGPGLSDDEFSIVVVINGVEEPIRPAVEAAEAMYVIDGRVDEGGRCTLSYHDISGAKEVWERAVLWPSSRESTCGPFRFRINAWDLDREALKLFFRRRGLDIGLRDFRRAIRDHSGISLYRDGFRILPYGEPDNDWLRLDRRRVNNPTMRLSNNQILGSIHLRADENRGLTDQTNREGLVSNDSYRHLQQVVLEILGYLEARRFKARRSLGVGPGNGASSLPEISTERDSQVDLILDAMERQDVLATGELVRDLRELLAKNRETTGDAIRQYAGLAVSGQLSGLVFSQLLHPLEQIRTETSCISDVVDGTKIDEESQEDLEVSLQKIESLIERMQDQISKLDPVAVSRKTRQIVEVDLEKCIDEVIPAFLERIVDNDIDFALTSRESCLAMTDPYVIHGVVAVLLDNAVYWVGQSDRARRIRIAVESDGFSLENNGPPILKDLWDQVFEPHFTTRDDAAGMGLTLARDLLATVGGQISLARKRKGVMFRVRVPGVAKN